MAESSWIGKSISIKCTEPAGTVFQGTIKDVRPEVITIVRAFRNGVPVRKPETEVKINSTNIASLELIPEAISSDIGTGVVTKPTPIKHPNLMLQQSQQDNSFQQPPPPPNNRQNKTQKNNNNNGANNSYQSMQMPRNKSPNTGNKKFFANYVPSIGVCGPPPPPQPDFTRHGNNINMPSTSKPIDMPQQQQQQYTGQQRGSNNNGNGSNNNNRNYNQDNSNNLNVGKNGKNGRRYQNSKNETFGTPVNDPTMDEDFDFEKNLALFNKQAVWEQINQMNSGKPDLLHHQAMGGNAYSSNSRHQQPQAKYRHDENILQSAPTQYRQIEVDYNSSRDYVSDDGLIIPSIPLIVRNRVQTAAEAIGLTWERQVEILSRGACDTALQLLGGAPRLKPNNRHQWPNIVVVCEEPYNDRKSEIGICTGRMLATHGLKVVVYVKELTTISRMSHELDLFKSTGNEYTGNISELPSSSDLIIISSRHSHLSPDITKWVMESRSPVLAIDPPVVGFVKIQAKCSILPILPLDDINLHACGKLYLCNLSIPNKFFHDAGIKYSPPFGHKPVIPIHSCD